MKEEVSQDILIGIYRILAGVPKSFTDSAEVYDSSKQGMRESHEWILEWGRKNNIDLRGGERKSFVCEHLHRTEYAHMGQYKCEDCGKWMDE